MSVRRIWVTSHDFQAPGMYEKEGFKRMAELNDGPRATSMWCTSSALVSSAGGTVRPSAFKVGQRHSPSPDTGQKSASPISIGRRAIEVEVANHVVAVAPVELLISFK